MLREWHQCAQRKNRFLALAVGSLLIASHTWSHDGNYRWAPKATFANPRVRMTTRPHSLVGLRASEFDSGEFDFGEYEAPSATSVAEAQEDDGPQLAPPEAETFLERETGDWECSNCEFTYKKLFGSGDFGPGTDFRDLPKTWVCPECGAPRDDFQSVVETVAGFAENQDFGFGFNTWTAGNKEIIIWGGLGAGFILFMAGYLLD
eukprot:CAMPEP_0172720110 /NCGR_PEP_ID=MMETSP1074-20121228/76146_1 /TAXON_ID=2916 /ORGANISM="Ceratium fusus, Strain PA161109" /LENGTH=204 /DNA_ID=CAMNT_0013545553 /DNA_START=69 /DNA_END=683 /DNA_ORIENTATION=-